MSNISKTGYAYPLSDILPSCPSCTGKSVRLIDVKTDMYDYNGGTRPVWHCDLCSVQFSGRTGSADNAVMGVPCTPTTQSNLNINNDDHDSYNGKVKKHQLDDVKRELERKLENAYCDFQSMIDDAMKRKEPETELDKLRSRVLQFELQT